LKITVRLYQLKWIVIHPGDNFIRKAFGELGKFLFNKGYLFLAVMIPCAPVLFKTVSFLLMLKETIALIYFYDFPLNPPELVAGPWPLESLDHLQLFWR